MQNASKCRFTAAFLLAYLHRGDIHSLLLRNVFLSFLSNSDMGLSLYSEAQC
jgi:hypothetical protein